MLYCGEKRYIPLPERAAFFLSGGHMNTFLKLAFLFYIGSSLGWVLELLFRRFISGNNPERKWINPGFMGGP